MAQTAAGVNPTGAALQPDFKKKIYGCDTDRKQCPVRAPQYQDLTGDGKDELIVGIEDRTGDGPDSLALWVFTIKDGVMTQILDSGGVPESVEVAGHDLILREPAGDDRRLVFSWNEQRQAIDHDFHER
ncbi:hypothetical protein ABR737_26990 [Streptomyces sp. Edi2]|uniref:hypothetical protein n=1 Tax=Streptomyces sp. Edi2 TaxID=3162528 RepID=UPI003306657D